MKILVTGSTGQIGSYCMDVGREQGHEMHGFDIRPNEKWTDIVGDIRDAEACGKAAEGMEAIVHCAAEISVQASMEDPVKDACTNVLGTLNMVSAARGGGVGRFVNFSSAAVYGNPEKIPISETHTISPLSPYGAGKAAAELYVSLYHRTFALSTVTLRPFNVYSSRQAPDNPYSGVISKFVKRVQEGKSPVVFGQGEQTRDFVHAKDVAQMAIEMACNGKTGAFNVGTGHSVRILDLARLCVGESGLNITHGPQPWGDIQQSVADVERAQATGWVPHIRLEEGLRSMFVKGLRI